MILSLSDEDCVVEMLEAGRLLQAIYSEKLLTNKISVKMGQLVAVDISKTLPEVVFRWKDITGIKVSSGYQLKKAGILIQADKLLQEYSPLITRINQGENIQRLNWIDTSNIPFTTIGQLDNIQLSWLPGWVPEKEMAIALQANPEIELKIRETCPKIENWLDSLKVGNSSQEVTQEKIRQAELAIINTIEDQVVYAAYPQVYDKQPFMQWDPTELNTLADFTGKTVIDIGSGTGKLAFIAAEQAKLVYAVEPITSLRKFIKEKAVKHGFNNICVLDGLIESIPLKSGIADITMEGHVFSQPFEVAHREMLRVTKKAGTIIHCPANTDEDNDKHKFLLKEGFAWSRFEEPGEGWKRKYWETI